MAPFWGGLELAWVCVWIWRAAREGAVVAGWGTYEGRGDGADAVDGHGEGVAALAGHELLRNGLRWWMG